MKFALRGSPTKYDSWVQALVRASEELRWTVVPYTALHPARYILTSAFPNSCCFGASGCVSRSVRRTLNMQLLQGLKALLACTLYPPSRSPYTAVAKDEVLDDVQKHTMPEHKST